MSTVAWLSLREGLQSLLGDHRLQLLESLDVETAQVIVECVDARYGATCQVLENRIHRKPFQVEDTVGSCSHGIDQKLDLRVHRIDHARSLLQPPESTPQLLSESLLLQEAVELDESTHPRQRLIRWSRADPPCVAASDTTPTFLPIPPRCPLASEFASSHLLGARGACHFLCHQQQGTGGSGAKFPLFARFSTRDPWPPATRWSEIQV